MPVDYEFLIAWCCLGFSLIYLGIQCFRLLWPVWSMKLDRNHRATHERFAKNTIGLTEKSVETAVTSQACFNRLFKDEDLTSDEKLAKKKLQFWMFFTAGTVALLYFVRFYPGIPPEASNYALDAVIIALGTVFGALADYRISRSAEYVAQALEAQTSKAD